MRDGLSACGLRGVEDRLFVCVESGRYESVMIECHPCRMSQSPVVDDLERSS